MDIKIFIKKIIVCFLNVPEINEKVTLFCFSKELLNVIFERKKVLLCCSDFTGTIIQEIEALEWYYKPEAELEKLKPLFFKDFTTRHSIYE